MERWFVAIVDGASLAVEAAAALLLTWGAASALLSILALAARQLLTPDAQRAVWLRLARWLVLSLEFQLTADLLRTSISQTWTDIGHVAALALVRTFLNRALEADLEKAASTLPSPAPSPPAD